MEYNRIKSLLDKYWEGSTSIEEENTLKKYFSSENVAEELRPFKSLFNFFTDESETQASDKLDQNVLDNIIGIKNKGRKIRAWKPFLKYAAAFALLIFATFTVFRYSNLQAGNTQVVYHDNPDDALKAYQEVKMALALVSNKMEKGTSKAVLGFSKSKDVNGIFKMIKN